MKKILLAAALSSSFVFGCGCIDMGTAPNLANSSVSKYKNQDKQIAQEINKVAEDIRESHRKYEYETSKRMEDTRILLTRQLELEKEILFNAVMINKIQAIVNTKKATETIIKNEEL